MKPGVTGVAHTSATQQLAHLGTVRGTRPSPPFTLACPPVVRSRVGGLGAGDSQGRLGQQGQLM